MNENSTTTNKDTDHALKLRSKLLSALKPLDVLKEAPKPLALDALRLLERIRTEIEAECQHQRLLSDYLAHNIAVLLLRVAHLGAPHEHIQKLGDAAAQLLWDAWIVDPGDFVVLAALAEHAVLGSPDAVRPELLVELAKTLSTPWAGDRMFAQTSRLVVHSIGAKDNRIRSAAEKVLATTISGLTSYLTKLPYHPEIAENRLKLQLVVLRRADGKARAGAYRQLRTWIADYDARFGETPALVQMIIAAALEAATEKGHPNRHAAVEAHDRLLSLAADMVVYDDENWMRVLRIAERADLFTNDERRTLADGLTHRIDRAPDAMATRLRRHRRDLWEMSGDTAALLVDSIERLRQDPKDRAAAAEIITRVLNDKKAGANDTDVPPEILQLAAEGASHSVYHDWTPADARMWVDVLTDRLGAEVATHAAVRHVLSAKNLRGDEQLVTKIVHLLESLGRADEAENLARQGIDKEGFMALRVWLARKLFETGSRLAEADALLRPALAPTVLIDGTAGLDAQKLRDEILHHPAYEESRRAELLEFETKIQVGTDKKHRLRVLFPGAGFVLAELIDEVAPPAYGQKHLRVMVRRNDLPSFLDIVDLQKGTELFAPVRGDDDKKSKGGLRVYWVAEGAVAEPGWSEEKRRKQVKSLEDKFKVNTGASLPLRIVRVLKKSQLAWAALESPPGVKRETFPADVCILASDLPDGTSLDALKEGVAVYAPVDATDDTRGAKGERRYRARGPVEIAEGGDRG